MSRKSKRFEVGDVFSIPIDDERLAYGQLVASWRSSGGHFYVAVFERIYRRDEEPSLDAVVREPLALLALSMDALLVHGHWQVVGRQDVDPTRIPWPAYKEGIMPPGTFDVVDHTGERRRRATDDEAETLPFRSVVAPIRLEKAIRALHGMEPWDDVYERLRPVAEDQTSAALLG